MKYRSSNADGRFVHYGGDVVSNVESSHGVMLYGGSTGGKVIPVGDDANISLTLEGKGTGGVKIGNSSQSLTLADSTSAFKGFHVATSTWSNAAISSGQIAELTFASTTFGVSYGDLVAVSFQDLAAPVVSGGYRLSTVATSVLTVLLTTPGSTASSTLSGSIQVAWADLT